MDFSIVIPTHNRPRQLEACLKAVLLQNYLRDRFEVIVVADGSAAAVPEGVVLLRQSPQKGPAAARNLGACRARGRFLAFTDDDCIPDPDWLNALAAELESQPAALVGGSVDNLLPSNRYASATQALLDFMNSAQPHFFPSNNIAMSADQFKALGGFDVSWPLAAAEDRDLCRRWLAASLPLLYASAAKVGHAHDLSFSGFFNQHFRYGRGACWFFRKHPRAKRLSVSALLTSEKTRPFLTLILLAQAATTAGFIRQRFTPAK